MAAVTMKAAILLKHLSSVSDAVKDLKIDVADNLSFLEAGGSHTQLLVRCYDSLP